MKKPSPGKENTDWEGKWNWAEHNLPILNAIWKKLLFLKSFLALLTSSNQMSFSMKTSSWQNHIQRNLSIYPLKTFLANVTTFMKRLQSHKKRHWILSQKQEIRQKAANDCICHERSYLYKNWEPCQCPVPPWDQGGMIFVSSGRGQLLNFKSQGGDTFRGEDDLRQSSRGVTALSWQIVGISTKCRYKFCLWCYIFLTSS